MFYIKQFNQIQQGLSRTTLTPLESFCLLEEEPL